MSQDKLYHTLPIGYILHKDYKIESVLGEGGFGITYRALYNDGHVAIKEYYPSGIATRKTNDANPYNVSHFDGKMAESFRKGIERFRQEAYLLKEFSELKCIVSVIDIFDENNTTYIVMKYIEGLTLQKLIEQEGPLPYNELMELMTPLLNDLSLIHESGLVHRDISPDNLLIGTDNMLHLIDFGSANHNNINESKTFTVILKAGYAPPEQYSPKGKLGPWTDVYGCCATIYYALTGNAPMDSLQRMQQENEEYNSVIMPESLSMVDKNVNAAITTGLSLSYKDRYPSVKMLLHALNTSHNTDNIRTEIRNDNNLNNIYHDKNDINGNRLKITGIKKIIPLIIVLFFIILGISIWGSQTDKTANTAEITGTTKTDNTTEITNASKDSGATTSTNSTKEANTTISANVTEASSTTISTYATEDSGTTETITDRKAPGNADSVEGNPDILTMVNMIGKTLPQAKDVLNELDSDIDIQTIEEYSKTYPEGTVIAQSIRSNTQFTKGNISAITLTVSLGDKPASTAGSTSSNNKSSGTSEAFKVTGSKKDDGYTTIHIGD